MRNPFVRELSRNLWNVTPRDHWQTDREFRRRQIVSAIVVVLGASVLAFSLRLDAGSPWFLPATFALAAVWVLGAFASGPLHLGRIATSDGRQRRPLLTPFLLGVALSLLFVVGSLIVREIEPLAEQVRTVLSYTATDSMWLLLLTTVVNGIAEELFFRGALHAAVRRHQVLVTTIAYTIATALTGNIMLAFAAALLGVVVGLQRRATGGILAPIITHLTWSVAMLFALPAILG